MNLEAFVLGCGGMMPLPYRHLTSVLLRREGDLFLFDGGEGTGFPFDGSICAGKINAIFVSHTHADHVTGLPGLLMLSSQVDRDDPLYIYGPPKIAEYIQSSRQVLDMYINYQIVVKEITEPGIVYQGEDFHVRAFPLQHTKTCVGYTLEEYERPGQFNPDRAKELGVPCGPLWSRLQNGEAVTSLEGETVLPEQVLGAPRKGRKFSYVTDTRYLPSIAEEVKNSDFLVCEGMFEKALAETAAEKKHMTAEQAATVARDGKVKKMALIHYSPRYTDSDLKLLLSRRKRSSPKPF